MSSKQSFYTVSSLTAELKTLLEEAYPIVWITGEITNFASPSSGHYYFTLKDSSAQIRAVMFRGQNKKLPFKPENGMEVTGLCRVSVYEPRGTYQIIFELLEPKGTGALQIAFEQLKKRLSDEGLFDDVHKTPLPYLPEKISVITSPSGAVIFDIINIINRRYPNAYIEIVPVRVQGFGAENELADAIELINARMNSDVIVLARGGGSLEDLQAFNSELLARSIHASKIPIVSAVGHDTDYTISDFVADLRAPTPSAAAELIMPVKKELIYQQVMIKRRLFQAVLTYLDDIKNNINAWTLRLRDPGRAIQDARIRIDDLLARCARACERDMDRNRDKLCYLKRTLYLHKPSARIYGYHALLSRIYDNLLHSYFISIEKKKSDLREMSGRLFAMNPMATLERGYSITRRLTDKIIITDEGKVDNGQLIETLLRKGRIISTVKGTHTHVKEDL